MTTQPVEHSNTDDQPSKQGWLREEHAVRFVKFGIVGGFGIIVNWLFFELGYYTFGFLGGQWAVLAGYAVGLLVSIFTNFVLNDIWTWADRIKGGVRHWFYRMAKYYVSASVAGALQVAVSWVSLQAVWSRFSLQIASFQLPVTDWAVPTFDLAPRLGLLTGIAAGMVVNFLASHLWAFEDAEAV